ncbi:aminotransferase [Anaerovorax sp. IOR16]|uniref:aminotransferase n=1 Tax=Anaerovorax sp. IOR16 TaxID=2773458 RepID=UPI0019CF812E|nr:aminotransferase [Anaerovorax sp. IOR16]
MKIKDFGVEIWMNLYENNCEYNLAETCVESLTVDEILTLSGEKESFYDKLLNMKLTYGAIEGSIPLREAITTLYRKVKVENLTITHGAIGANALSIMTLVDRGDRVISVLPTYQQHYSIPESIGADIQILRLKEENNFLPDLDELKELAIPGTKLICINNPNNPTGAVMDEEYLLKIVDIAKGCGAYLLCDEAYRGLTHDSENSFTASVADLYEKGISTASMSKTFSAAGLRLGWVAGPEDFIEKINRQRDYHVISVGMIDDALATIILKNKDKIVKRNIEIVLNNAKLLDEWVAKEPLISYVKPKGGTTAFLKYDIDMSSVDFCVKLLEQTGVMLLPGSALDMEGYLRIGYCNNPEIIRKGLEKISEFLKQYS